MLELSKVNFSYSNKTILNQLSLKLADHKITTIIGPNGSGKSTLFKLFTRTLKPDSGSVYLDKQDIWQLKANNFAQKVAIVHQANPVYDQIKVKDLISFGRLPYQSLWQEEKKSYKVDEIIDELNLTSLKNEMLTNLSGGQKQRVWLALALAQEPEYLFLDEPTTYLDLHFQSVFLRLIKRLNEEQGLTLCLILHDLNQALKYSDQVVLLNQGEIKAQGAPEEVIRPEIIKPNFKIDCQLIKTDHGNFLEQY